MSGEVMKSEFDEEVIIVTPVYPTEVVSDTEQVHHDGVPFLYAGPMPHEEAMRLMQSPEWREEVLSECRSVRPMTLATWERMDKRPCATRVIKTYG